MNEDQLKEERIFLNLFPDFLNHMEDSVYIVDKYGRMVFVNKAVEKIEGITSEQIHGKFVNDVYEQDYSPSMHVLETGKSLFNYENKYFVNGKNFIQQCSAFPIKDQGEVIAVVSIHKDVTPLKELVTENILLQREKQQAWEAGSVFEQIIGEDANFKKALNVARAAALSDSTVLLTGATGAGKEVFARAIHKSGQRKDKAFLAINCAAIPDTLLESILFGTSKGSFTGALDTPGLFEQADGGTLFLDEINSMSLGSQAKLLRVLETKEIRHIGGQEDIKIDVRIISSCNQQPYEEIEEKRLREDLFYRLAVVNVVIPSLSERQSDIIVLANYFIDFFNQKLKKNILSFDRKVHDAFVAYSWPGNVRQLRHCIEYAITMADPSQQIITEDLLPQYFEEEFSEQVSKTRHQLRMEDHEHRDAEGASSALDSENIFEEIENKEIEKIVKTLLECNGNVSHSARKLGMHRQSLIYRMKKYNITKR